MIVIRKKITWIFSKVKGQNHISLALFIAFTIGLTHCKEEPEPPVVTNPCSAVVALLDTTFGIDYDNPSLYLTSGLQSNLNPTNLAALQNELGQIDATLNGVKSVVNWINKEFKPVDSGGALIGKKDVNDLFEVREFYGCHSQALLVSSICRSYGIPAVIVETASVKWAEEFNDGTNQGYSGHVMSELYIDDHWILMDNNGGYVNEYIPTKPYISSTGCYLSTPAPLGLFAIGKGLDSWDYGVHDNSDTRYLMENFAHDMKCYNDFLYTVTYTWK